MAHTPRSRTPSRVGTPISGPSLSRLSAPNLRSAPSVSSYKVYSHASSALQTPVSTSPPDIPVAHTTDPFPSSSSSSVTMDTPESMIMQEPDSDADTIGDHEDEGGRAIVPNAAVGDEEAKRSLRDTLRKTLNKKESHGDLQARQRRRKGKGVDMLEIPHTPVDVYPPRQYFVLTDAGKPVFISRKEDEDSESTTSTIGIMQALISIFLDDGDKLRCINSGGSRITFVLRSPLYYVCVSSWGEPESVTRFHLEYLHLQILSVISAEQLRRMFERRRNFDVRRLLSGAEPLMFSLLDRMEFDLAISTSSLQALKLEPSLRKSIADTLVPTSKIKEILYVILIAQEQVVTLVRPRKHSIHPADLHILINTIHSSSIINSSASASWLPVCLPKFNSAAFVNAYVTFLDTASASKGHSEEATVTQETSTPTEAVESAVPSDRPYVEVSRAADADAKIALVCVCGSADFEVVRSWCDKSAQRLQNERLLSALSKTISSGSTEYSISDLGIPGLRHFVYKSRSHVQITMPKFEDPYDDVNEQRRLITLYQTLYDAIHAKSGQESTLKLQYIRTERESVMGWITQPFELYMALSPLLPKSAAIGAANAIARWVQKEEKRLFLRDAPVF